MSRVGRGFLKCTPVNAAGVKIFGLAVDGVLPIVHPPVTHLLALQLSGPLFYCSGRFSESKAANRRHLRSKIGRKTSSEKVLETSFGQIHHDFFKSIVSPRNLEWFYFAFQVIFGVFFGDACSCHSRSPHLDVGQRCSRVQSA